MQEGKGEECVYFTPKAEMKRAEVTAIKYNKCLLQLANYIRKHKLDDSISIDVRAQCLCKAGSRINVSSISYVWKVRIRVEIICSNFGPFVHSVCHISLRKEKGRVKLLENITQDTYLHSSTTCKILICLSCPFVCPIRYADLLTHSFQGLTPVSDTTCVSAVRYSNIITVLTNFLPRNSHLQ